MSKKGRGNLFAAAQQIGKSLFLPIAILPPAGILLGIGSSFTNPTTIATYGLSGILHPGTLLFGMNQMFAAAGNTIFGNLALIFALAVALGMAKREKGVAVLSAGIFYLVMLTTMNVCLTLDGSIADGIVSENIKEGAITSVLGIQTLQMGVFGGILAGITAAALCNRFYKTVLPDSLAFFSGTRFVPIISMAFAIITGVISYFVWPLIQSGIYALGGIVHSSGYFGTFVYGCIERALIPFGLHHIFYMPFWQTGVGGTMLIDGVEVAGAQNIFFAQLASPNTVKFSVDACRFLTGKYPFMMAGLPGAALAPSLFAIHVFFAGISFMLCHLLHICVGTTFSCGFIDLILYGVLPGQAKSNWLMLLPVFAFYFVIYFLVFRYFILKKDLKTPGREADGCKVTTPMIVCNSDEYSLIRPLKTGAVKAGDDFLELIG